MTDVSIVTRETIFTIAVSRKATMLSMTKLIKHTYEAILKYLDKIGFEPKSPPFIHYVNLNWDELNKKNKFLSFLMFFTHKWDMNIGFAVSKELKGEEQYQSGIIPAGRYIQVIHRGPYQKVGNTYTAALEYIKKNNLKIKDESIEFYLNDPSKTPKEELETEILIPIKE